MAKKATINMTVVIGGSNYLLYIGFGFLNNIQKLETEEYGGLEMALLGLLEGDPLTVRTVLQAALTTSDEISEADIDQYIEQEMDIDKFCKDFLKLLESANLTKTRYKKMMPILKELKEAADQELEKVQEKIKEQIQKITTEELSTTTE